MKYMVFLVGAAIVAIVIVVIMSTITNSSNNAVITEQQTTTRILAQEQTKQEAQQLRAEETGRTTNALTLILGSILAFGCIGIVIVFLNDRFTKHRIYEMQEMGRQERMQIRELKQLEYQKQLPRPQTQWYLTGNTNYGTNQERQVVIYEDGTEVDYR